MAAKHGGSFEVIERASNGKATAWLASCACKTRWTGDSYEVVEDKWRQHVHALTGVAPKAMGSQADRWSA
jgi:hypothetical protein